MLVLARKPNQSIHIGEDVRIVVVQIRSGRVRLGIEAPAHVRVRRNEVPSLAADSVELEFELATAAETD